MYVSQLVPSRASHRVARSLRIYGLGYAPESDGAFLMVGLDSSGSALAGLLLSYPCPHCHVTTERSTQTIGCRLTHWRGVHAPSTGIQQPEREPYCCNIVSYRGLSPMRYLSEETNALTSLRSKRTARVPISPGVGRTRAHGYFL